MYFIEENVVIGHVEAKLQYLPVVVTYKLYTAKVKPSLKGEGTPLYFMHKLLDDERLTEDQRKELLAEGRTGPYTGASLYDRHLSLRPHLRQFYERDEFLHYYNQVRSTWRNKYYPEAADGTPAGHQGGNNWNGNSGAIVPVNQGFNHQVGYGRGGGGGPGGHQGWNGNQGFN